MTVVLLLMALVLAAAGVDLNALLPHLPPGLIIPGVAVTGALWIGAFGCFLMGVASGGVELWKR